MGLERELFNEAPKSRQREIIARIFGRYLVADLQHISLEKQSIAVLPQNSLGASNPQLLKFYQDLEKDVSQPVSPEETIELYDHYRNEFLSGETDLYGRGGFLQTVPSEHDSAAVSVITELELRGEELVAEGPMYRVFEGRHAKGRFGFNRRLFAAEKTESEVPPFAGKRIIVPSSSWAGYYAQLFVPNNGDPSFVWSYCHTHRPLDEELPKVVREKLAETISGIVNEENYAVLYTLHVYCDLYDKDGRFRNFIKKLAGSLRDIPVPEEEFEQLFDQFGKFPERFKPDPQGTLGLTRDHFEQLISKYQPREVPDELLTPQIILTSRQNLRQDPGLITWAVDQLTKGDVYPRWLEFVSKAVRNTLTKAQQTENPTEAEIRSHVEANSIFDSFRRIRLPWQAEFILGESFGELAERLARIDDDFNRTVMTVNLFGDSAFRTFTRGEPTEGDQIVKVLQDHIKWCAEAMERLSVSSSDVN